jgi:hypothetical protein
LPLARIQARCKNTVKVIVNFIRKGIWCRRIKVGRNGGGGVGGQEEKCFLLLMQETGE